MQTDNEKYNETVQPNTAFLNELKDKLPEFFTKDGSFDLDKFKNQLKDKIGGVERTPRTSFLLEIILKFYATCKITIKIRLM